MYNTLHTVAKVASRPEKLILILKKLIKLRKKNKGITTVNMDNGHINGRKINIKKKNYYDQKTFRCVTCSRCDGPESK